MYEKAVWSEAAPFTLEQLMLLREMLSAEIGARLVRDHCTTPPLESPVSSGELQHAVGLRVGMDGSTRTLSSVDSGFFQLVIIMAWTNILRGRRGIA